MNDQGGGFDGCSVSDHVYDLLGWLLLSPLPEIQVPGPVRGRQHSPSWLLSEENNLTSYCICIIQFYDSMVHWWNKFVDQYLWKYFILLKESEEINVIDTWYLLPSSKCTFTKDIVCRNPSLKSPLHRCSCTTRPRAASSGRRSWSCWCPVPPSPATSARVGLSTLRSTARGSYGY